MNDASLFSAQWYRVRHVRPQLASDVQVVRHVYRGRVVYILHRRATSQYQKLDQQSYALIDRFDGRQTVEDVWEQAIAGSDDIAITQDDWIRLLSDLHNAELLIVDRRVAVESLFQRRKKNFSLDRSQRYLNPLFIRFSLHDPDDWLNHLKGFSTSLFSRFSAALWLGLMISALLVAFTNADRLYIELSDPELLSGMGLMLLCCLYPAIKAVHELAHALAVKRGDGDVHEFGIAMMVFFPIPYIDASASSVFPEKRDRIMVSAAGILAELALAAIGILLWACTGGWLAQLGFSVFLIAGVSSLLFNGNPLLKFDGYYILSDWLEIPNMYRYSRDTILSCLRSIITGTVDQLKLQQDRLERIWLIAFGILSGLYRTFLMLAIAWMLSTQWYFVGLMLALVTCYLFVARPFLTLCRTVYKDKAFRSVRSVLVISTVPLLLIAGCSGLPVRHSTVSTGVIWLPDDAVIRAEESCEVIESAVLPGQQITTGQELFVCVNPDTTDRVNELMALIDELQVRRAGVLARDPLAMQAIDAELEAAEQALDKARTVLNAEHQVSRLSGVFELIGDSSLTGRYLNRGDVIGYIVPESDRTIRVAVDEYQMSKIDAQLRTIEVRFGYTGESQDVYQTYIVRRSPAATRQVNTLALTSEGGGPVKSDPEGDGRQTLKAVFDLELSWPEDVKATTYVGSHVDIRFVFNDNTLFTRLIEATYLAISRIRHV